MELHNSKDWAKIYRACNFIEKGVCEYADERVYLSTEALQRACATMKGRPVIIDHVTGITPKNMHKYAVGYVTEVECSFGDSSAFDCKFVIFDDEGKQVITDGYSVSCAYKPLAFGPGGTWHNVPYDREIVDLEFTHLALVQNPRYEEAKVYENAKEEKGRWITIKGTHVFIKDGQSVEDAMKETFKSSSATKKQAGYKTGAHPMEERNRNKIKEELEDTSVKYVEDLDSLKRQIDDKLKKGVEPGERRKFERVLERIEDVGFIRQSQEQDNLQGKYERDDADFDVEQLKKDIKAAQKQGHEEIEDIAEFLGLDEDEVRETMDDGFNYDKLDKNNKYTVIDQEGEEERTFDSYEEALAHANMLKRIYKEDGIDNPSIDLDEVSESGEYVRSMPQEEDDSQEVSKDGDQKIEKELDKLETKIRDAQQRLKKTAPADKRTQNNIKQEIKDLQSVYDYKAKKLEKHNNKEEIMNVEEFFNKMGEMIEEKFNACRGRMNEAEEADDDDKFEMDGEVYSKKELVNAFKEKKNAEMAEEEGEEEEKQNSADEFFNAMEERMAQQQQEASDKIEVYSQQKGLEKGKKIYG